MRCTACPLHMTGPGLHLVEQTRVLSSGVPTAKACSNSRTHPPFKPWRTIQLPSSSHQPVRRTLGCGRLKCGPCQKLPCNLECYVLPGVMMGSIWRWAVKMAQLPSKTRLVGRTARSNATVRYGAWRSPPAPPQISPTSWLSHHGTQPCPSTRCSAPPRPVSLQSPIPAHITACIPACVLQSRRNCSI